MLRISKYDDTVFHSGSTPYINAYEVGQVQNGSSRKSLSREFELHCNIYMRGSMQHLLALARTIG